MACSGDGGTGEIWTPLGFCFSLKVLISQCLAVLLLLPYGQLLFDILQKRFILICVQISFHNFFANISQSEYELYYLVSYNVKQSLLFTVKSQLYLKRIAGPGF